MAGEPRENLPLELASPFECGSRVNSRDSPKWKAFSQADYKLLSMFASAGIQDSLGFWIPRHGFRIPGTGFQIPCKWNLDSGFQTLAGFLEL